MKVDYLEIGTCDFEIADGHIDPSKQYLFVEPIDTYLDRLPSGDNVIKLNSAVSYKEGVMDMFFVNEIDIQKYNLPYWVKGCNRLNEKHPTVLKLLSGMNLPDLFLVKQVTVTTFNKLMRSNGVSEIVNLKIDTEGHDHVIMLDVIKYMNEYGLNIDTIKFEYIPAFNNTNALDGICMELSKMYPNQKLIGDNMFLFK
jgi:hypothetical protein